MHGTIHPETYGAQAETYAAEDPSMTAAETYHQAQAEVQDYAWPDEETVVPAAAARRLEVPRSRRPLFVMAAIIAVGIAGIGASFAYKSSKTGPHEIATIKAMSGPTKIQPESPGAADVAKQDAAILDKSQQQTPVGLVDHKERPVDLALQRDAGGAASPIRMAEAVPPGGAAAVPVPTPPAGPQSASGQQELQSYGIGALIEPKRVKTVSVRSDGTLLPNDTPPPMPPSTASSPAFHAGGASGRARRRDDAQAGNTEVDRARRDDAEACPGHGRHRRRRQWSAGRCRSGADQAEARRGEAGACEARQARPKRKPPTQSRRPRKGLPAPAPSPCNSRRPAPNRKRMT